MDTSSEKTNNDIATQPTAQEKQVPHIAAPAEQAPDEQMGWEVASRRQRGREAVEAASPNSQPARKDMRTQQHEGPLTASAASDKQKQTTPPPRKRGRAASSNATLGAETSANIYEKEWKGARSGNGGRRPPPKEGAIYSIDSANSISVDTKSEQRCGSGKSEPRQAAGGASRGCGRPHLRSREGTPRQKRCSGRSPPGSTGSSSTGDTHGGT